MLHIKICGITRPDDARAAADAGADAIGLVFARSPRRVNMVLARRIVTALPPFVTAVGVFAGQSVTTIRRTAAAVGLSVVQLHSDEKTATIAALAPLRVIRAVRVGPGDWLREVRSLLRGPTAGRPAAILLDSFAEDVRGGTGRPFDWSRVAEARRWGPLAGASLVLAGGLTAANVARAVGIVRPDAVDVSGGVELSPGVKDAGKMNAFIRAARNSR